MTILVTGSTGAIGSLVVANLTQQAAGVHALTRSTGRANFPPGVTPVKGDQAHFLGVGLHRRVTALG